MVGPLRDSAEITQLVERARVGDEADRSALYAAVHDNLRALARRVPGVGRYGDSMQATALVNALFIEFERRFPPPPRDFPESRATFYRSAALSMRSILRDHWRARQAQKRTPVGGVESLRSDPPDPIGARDAETFMALDAALDRLEAFNRRWYDVVLHRYFAERTAEETAELLGISRVTVTNDWRLARSWLRQEIGA